MTHFERGGRSVCKLAIYRPEHQLSHHIPDVDCVFCIANLKWWLRELESALYFTSSPEPTT